ncbi:hypothetical protein T8K17_25070 [Thalassobaculum sp. OXR-137]|uniref:hypothetical protein n=1 Tax=Thalassobaculum sp. OXR-137 TaxID=3100173 RepID=UPI002AC8F65D|nr:hypothetical protein [Thalassobaculum sp. OXR-137]WPZ34486.1 hypothetical protein T8K17_25070 [Thalassobaculum sp. OXR-137]
MSGTIGEGPSGEKRREVPYLGIVKIASVVMGIMIVVGLAVIGVTIAKRLSGAGEESAAVAPAGPATASSVTAALGAPGDLDVAIPAGSRVVAVESDGRRLIVRLTLSGGDTAALLLDADTGARLGLLTLVPENR